MKQQLAMQLYSVRTAVEEDFFGTLKRLKEFGYDGVEFAGLYGYTPDEVKKMCEDAGLVPISAHVSLQDFSECPEKVVSDYAKIGCRFLAIPWLNDADRPGGKCWEDTKKKISRIADVCEEAGITLLYHNHDFEFLPYEGGYLLDAIYAADDRLQSELDTCWAAVGGEEPAAYLEKFAGRAPVVHLKDFDLSGPLPKFLQQRLGKKGEGEKQLEFRPVGYGMQDVESLLAAAKKVGAGWLVVEQDNPSLGKDRMTCAKMSAEFLRDRLL